ncbi:hypothetical protein QQF64_026883 [Cirrhinus molitorella]|uniref:Uncharacterized protein n=1 Tax=Cirrhinus molitorella TaxID=172907 RepID=A0ABR3NAU2_9TELE
MSQSLHVLTYNDQALGQRVRSEEDSLRLCCAYPLITNADADDWTAVERFEVLPQISSTNRVYMRTEGVVHTPERTRTNGMPLFDAIFTSSSAL